MTRVIGSCGLVLSLLFASSLAAQTNADRVRASVKPGQKVSVVDDGGQEVHGRIGEMTADALTVLDEGKRADVPYDRIVTIDRPDDSLANGALIGLGVGTGLGLVAILSEDDSQCTPDGFFCDTPDRAYVAGVLVLGGLGAAVGVGIDALIHRNRAIYRRGGGAVTSAAAIVGHGRRGVALSVAW